MNAPRHRARRRAGWLPAIAALLMLLAPLVTLWHAAGHAARTGPVEVAVTLSAALDSAGEPASRADADPASAGAAELCVVCVGLAALGALLLPSVFAPRARPSPPAARAGPTILRVAAPATPFERPPLRAPPVFAS